MRFPVRVVPDIGMPIKTRLLGWHSWERKGQIGGLNRRL
jgi:hypothetical protein